MLLFHPSLKRKLTWRWRKVRNPVLAFNFCGMPGPRHQPRVEIPASMMNEAQARNLGTHGLWCQERQITLLSSGVLGKPLVPLGDRYLMPSDWTFSAESGVTRVDQVDWIAGTFSIIMLAGNNYYLLNEPVKGGQRLEREMKNTVVQLVFSTLSSCVVKLAGIATDYF